jgi:hypothetical protein
MKDSTILGFSKKGNRNLSDFFSQELLYDYITDRLDPETRASLDKEISKSRQLRNELDKIRAGLKYCGDLSKTQASPTLLEKIILPSSYLEVLIQKSNFEQWPQGIKWGIEAMTIAVGITVVAILIPWDKVLRLNLRPDSSIVIAELQRDKDMPEISDTEKNDQPTSDVKSDDKGVVKFQDETKPSEIAKTVEKALPPAALQESKPAETKKPPEPAKIVAPVVSIAAKNEKAQAQTVGSLYRGTLRAANIEAITPKIVERILAMGGRKAGEVELGWKKGNSSYFHFTIPEAKYNELNKLFAEYGKIKIQKERHDRIMPDGIIRLIVLIEEGNSR